MSSPGFNQHMSLPRGTWSEGENERDMRPELRRRRARFELQAGSSEKVRCFERMLEKVMKALVFGGPGRKAIEERPKPAIQLPGDAIVKMVKTTICGTDLHILKGDVA